MSPIEHADILDLIRRQMNEGEQVLRHMLERQLFASDPFLARVPIVPVPRWKRQWWKVRGYLTILGKALRGVDLVEPGDDY